MKLGGEEIVSKECLKCFEAWDYDDYVCPVCDGATVDAESDMEPTLKYVFNDEYDVIRISTGKSIWGNEPLTGTKIK